MAIQLISKSLEFIKLSDEEYFAKKDYLSNSKLGLINPAEGGSVEKFKEGLSSDYSDSLALGTAIHNYLLQPDFYIIADLVKPNGKLGLWAEEVYKLRQINLPLVMAFHEASKLANYYAGKLDKTRLKTAIRRSLKFYLERSHYLNDVHKEIMFLSESVKDKFDKCVGNLQRSSVTQLLNPERLGDEIETFNEYAIFCTIEYVDEETGEIFTIKFKAKLDNFHFNHLTKTIILNDVKTTGKPVTYFMGNHVKVKDPDTDEYNTQWYEGSFQHYHYHRQLAVYGWLLKSVAKVLYNYDYKLELNILAIETIPEFNNKIYKLNGKHFKAGLDEFQQLIKLVAYAT